ncbi:MAG: 30S ribosome-binding factor RbfA [Bacilli bacterium]|nr:30S ribosome-binding factor RbfA [Bacilli bacterium]
MNFKIDRINNMLLEQISYILEQEIKDDDIKFVTITAVKTTNDLSFAKVYFTVLNNDPKVTECALNNAKGYIRKLLYDRVELRHIPELTFTFDESIEYGKKIEDIIEKIHEEN